MIVPGAPDPRSHLQFEHIIWGEKCGFVGDVPEQEAAGSRYGLVVGLGCANLDHSRLRGNAKTKVSQYSIPKIPENSKK